MSNNFCRTIRRIPAAVLLLGLLVASTASAATPDCRAQMVGDSKVEMCLVPGEMFQHDTYLLKADGAVVFAIADDFVEDVQLRHVVAEGPSVEFKLSRQGAKIVDIKGGCKPVLRMDEGSSYPSEVARVCNFSWGDKVVVKDVRFDF
jgi:hypothetical protein